ncbi:hypothetical protein EDC01DRAFT_682360 [Geopyxis carbonaria]|nr:hypothetical protein EDC01DRAFT_682360 [Geopyxis carbonaria]
MQYGLTSAVMVGQSPPSPFSLPSSSRLQPLPARPPRPPPLHNLPPIRLHLLRDLFILRLQLSRLHASNNTPPILAIPVVVAVVVVRAVVILRARPRGRAPRNLRTHQHHSHNTGTPRYTHMVQIPPFPLPNPRRRCARRSATRLHLCAQLGAPAGALGLALPQVAAHVRRLRLAREVVVGLVGCEVGGVVVVDAGSHGCVCLGGCVWEVGVVVMQD